MTAIGMAKIISFDMDGTLIDPGFTDWVWGYGIPTLYAEKRGLAFETAKSVVEAEYRKVGPDAIEWYDIKYWFQFFQLGDGWNKLMKQFVDKISVYSDVIPILNRLKGKFPLVLTSNATREFIDIELEAVVLRSYFDRIFSATSDFGELKKTTDFYRRICQILGSPPEEVVHVGDHLHYDYRVPRALGIHAYYLDRSAQESGDFVLWNLIDLEKELA